MSSDAQLPTTLQSNPVKARKRSRAVITGVLIGVPGLIGVYFFLILPNMTGPHRGGNAVTACINNLRQIDAAKQEWALEMKAPSNAVPTWDNIRPFLGRGIAGAMPQCPKDGIYKIRELQSPPTCSIPGHTLD